MLLDAAFGVQIVQSSLELTAAIVHLVPNFDIGVSGTASSPVAKVKWGGQHLAGGLQSFANAMGIVSSILQNRSQRVATEGTFKRRNKEWDFQGNLAEKEIAQINKQITAAEIRRQIAEKDLKNHEKQITQSEEVETFLRAKYTNQELYQWMSGQISALYFQSYQMAYDLAKRAERSMQFELGLENTNFIQFGYWDGLKKGLLAGERLAKDIRRMEKAYMEQNKRDYEIKIPVSLQMIDPQALIDLRKEGSCTFDVPELLYDIYYPGQFFRRIKSLYISIPCIAGPNTNVGVKLTLLKNRVRKNSRVSDSDDYQYKGIEDTRFNHNLIGIQSIATSNAQNDSGMFELNFRDERYFPFEGAGAICSMRLELPTEFRSFDYFTISDVLINILFTARDGGDAFKSVVNEYLRNGINRWLDEVATEGSGLLRLFSLKQDFPEVLYHLQQLNNGNQPISLNIVRRHFPLWLKDRDILIEEDEGITIYSQLGNNVELLNGLSLKRDNSSSEPAPFGKYYLMKGQNASFESPENIFILVRYTISVR